MKDEHLRSTLLNLLAAYDVADVVSELGLVLATLGLASSGSELTHIADRIRSARSARERDNLPPRC